MARNLLLSDKAHYIRELYSTVEDDILKKIWLSAPNHCRRMQITPDEGMLLQILLTLVKASKVLEIGTMVGYSSTWIARILPKNGLLVTIDKSEKYQTIAKANINMAGLSNNVKFILGDAKQALFDIRNSIIEEKNLDSETIKSIMIKKSKIQESSESILDIQNDNFDQKIIDKTKLFDCVFIDGKKTDYLDYLNLVLPMIKKGGLIIADNTLLFETIYKDDNVHCTSCDDIKLAKMKNVMKKFNERLADKEHFMSTIIPTYDGLTINIKL